MKYPTRIKPDIQDAAAFERTQETIALLKILSLGNQEVAEGKVVPAKEAIRVLRKRIDA